MSVVLYEGVVTTPRNLDQGGRRSVPSAAITLPIACCQASPRVRMRSYPHSLWTQLWRHSNNPIAPREFPSGLCKSMSSEGLLQCIIANVKRQQRIVWQRRKR